jgi:hypothetical protein
MKETETSEKYQRVKERGYSLLPGCQGKEKCSTRKKWMGVAE